MTFEWDPAKAASNLKKHRVAFVDAAAVFLDELAITFPDPDHSSDENREITIVGRLCLSRTASVRTGFESSVRV